MPGSVWATPGEPPVPKRKPQLLPRDSTQVQGSVPAHRQLGGRTARPTVGYAESLAGLRVEALYFLELYFLERKRVTGKTSGAFCGDPAIVLLHRCLVPCASTAVWRNRRALLQRGAVPGTIRPQPTC